MEEIVFENTAFSVDHWARFSKTEFMAECLAGGFFSNYHGPQQAEILEILYQLIYDAARTTKKA